MNIQDLNGETLTHIDLCGDEILLTTKSGRQIVIRHDQDCCEYVRIQGIEGDWIKILGRPIIEATEEVVDRGAPSPSDYAESWTRTTHKFKTDAGTVVTRWVGESNGYYSESVSIHEITRAVGK